MGDRGEVVGDAVLGLAVIADQSLIAGAYYHALARPWGPSLATDQVLGGGTLWILGDIVGLPFLAAQLIQMIREDESEAAVIDAELDARDAARAAASRPARAGRAQPGPALRAGSGRRGPGSGRGGSPTRDSWAGSRRWTTAASNPRTRDRREDRLSNCAGPGRSSPGRAGRWP